MSGVLNKIKEAVTGHSAAAEGTSSTGPGVTSGNHAGHTSGPHNTDTENKLDPRIDSDNSRYGSSHHGGLNSGSVAGVATGTTVGESGPHNSGIANRLDPRTDTTGSTGRSDNIGGSHDGLNPGVESTRLTSLGHIGQLGQGSSAGVGQGFPGLSGQTGSTDRYGDGIESRPAKFGLAGQEHHHEREAEAGALGAGAIGAEHLHRHHQDNIGNTGSLTGSNTTGTGYTGSDNINASGFPNTNTTSSHHRHERELEAGAVGAGIAGAEHHHHHDHSGTTGGSSLSREELEQRIEPHQHAGENINEYTTPSSFSHGKHEGLGERALNAVGLGHGNTAGHGSSTTGSGLTGGALTSDTGRGGVLGNERERLAEGNTGTGYGSSTGNEDQFGGLHSVGDRSGRTSSTVDVAPGNVGSGAGTGNRNI